MAHLPVPTENVEEEWDCRYPPGSAQEPHERSLLTMLYFSAVIVLLVVFFIAAAACIFLAISRFIPANVTCTAVTLTDAQSIINCNQLLSPVKDYLNFLQVQVFLGIISIITAIGSYLWERRSLRQ
jgi:hypothetical protein